MNAEEKEKLTLEYMRHNDLFKNDIPQIVKQYNNALSQFKECLKNTYIG